MKIDIVWGKSEEEIRVGLAEMLEARLVWQDKNESHFP